MTQAVERVYDRFHRLANEIDVKDEKVASGLKSWQVNALHELAEEAEAVLHGSRRKEDRRS